MGTEEDSPIVRMRDRVERIADEARENVEADHWEKKRRSAIDFERLGESGFTSFDGNLDNLSTSSS